VHIDDHIGVDPSVAWFQARLRFRIEKDRGSERLLDGITLTIRPRTVVDAAAAYDNIYPVLRGRLDVSKFVLLVDGLSIGQGGNGSWHLADRSRDAMVHSPGVSA